MWTQKENYTCLLMALTTESPPEGLGGLRLVSYRPGPMFIRDRTGPILGRNSCRF